MNRARESNLKITYITFPLLMRYLINIEFTGIFQVPLMPEYILTLGSRLLILSSIDLAEDVINLLGRSSAS
jgi:hypothetical protein